MATTGGLTGDKLKVFVSYSRRDIDFAEAYTSGPAKLKVPRREVSPSHAT
jgi:hypothetical protein